MRSEGCIISEQEQARTLAPVKLLVCLGQMNDSFVATGYREHPVSGKAKQLLGHHLPPTGVISSKLNMRAPV